MVDFMGRFEIDEFLFRRHGGAMAMIDGRCHGHDDDDYDDGRYHGHPQHHVRCRTSF